MKSLLLAVVMFSTGLFFQTTGDTHSDIVAELIIWGSPLRVATLDPAQERYAIEQLQKAQRQATGKRSQETAFLLAALGSNYEQNRDYLVQALRGCNSAIIKENCDQDKAAFLIALYERGHHEVLYPLLAVGMHSYNAAASEMSGGFYGDVLVKKPSEFLETIRPLTAPTQSKLCQLAGSGDGGGMRANQLKQVKKQLLAIGDGTALRCLKRVEAGARPQ
jgi:hypothetical protein